MAKKRVRITDENDPLNSTDRVLAGFEQVSKLTSQQDNKLGSQEDNKLTSQPVNKSASQQSSSSSESKHEPAPVNELVNKSTSQLPNKSNARKDNKSASQQDRKSSKRQVSKTTSKQINKPESQEGNKSTSQPVNKPKLRKSTFQISEGVLSKLEQLHLRLQLELGKKDAPYKEVIVEEAIVQLLDQMNSDSTELLEALSKRQTERGN